MKIHGLNLPGRRGVVFELDPRTAADVWLHLEGSMHAEHTTRASRISIAGLLPQLQRAIAATGFANLATLQQLGAAIRNKPAPPPLDDAVRDLAKG